MRSLLYPLRLLLGSLAFSLLAACSDSGNNSGSDATDDIDTLNIYFDYSGDGLTNAKNFIYSFNPEDGISVERAKFNTSGNGINNRVLTLNTDEDKQGFEYTAFVNDSSVYLLNSVNAEITPLITSSSTICRIYHNYSASQSSFDGDEKKRILFDKPMITVATNATAENCGKLSDFFTLISFEINEETGAIEKIKRTEINPALIRGSNILDYDFSEVVDSVTKKGRAGFLGIDVDGRQLILYDENNDIIWEASVPNDVTGFRDPIQITKTKMLVRLDNDIYILDVNELFDIATRDQIPAQSALDSLFDTPALSLENTSLVTNFRYVNNDDHFVLEDGDTLYFYSNNQLEPFFDTQSDTYLNNLYFGITDNNVVLLNKIYKDDEGEVLFETFSQVNPENSVESTIISYADKFEWRVIDDQFYVNTLNASLEAGWQAHWFNSRLAQKTYDNSRFLFLEDTRTPDTSLLLLSSDAGTSAHPMIEPSVYAFDSTQSDGRRNNFSYGQLNSNVYGVKWGSIVNDIYGNLKFDVCHGDCESAEPEHVTEHYFFKPTQTSSEEESLTLIERKAAE